MESNKITIENGTYIRSLNESDIHDDYINGLNNPLVNRFMVSVRNQTQTFQTVKDFVNHNRISNDAVLFGIWTKDSTAHCGTVRIHGIENVHHTASIGVCIFDEKCWGKDLGSKSILAATQWGFQTQKLRWIEAGIYSQNIQSEKAFLKAGYEWVCDFNGKYLFEGKPSNVKIFAARHSQ